ncbi:MAG TPA: YdeI/OmpD-associated family protein, partial [Verrucomicrobiae bacterium]|nr:YdeI/OmpD-associated family protein [Verrucomicrobiae bacterium]
ILLGCGLDEELKWGKPCYAFEGGNVVVIQGFKACCALLFFKGALLKDPNHVLVKTGENTIVGRQMRFTNVQQIRELEPVVRAYIQEAIEIEKAGLKVDVEKSAAPKIPEELKSKFAENAALKKAFEALTPGRQRGYIFYFSGAKQSKTRESRIEKCMPQILKGKGFNE